MIATWSAGADTRRTRRVHGSEVVWNQLTVSGAVVDQTVSQW